MPIHFIFHIPSLSTANFLQLCLHLLATTYLMKWNYERTTWMRRKKNKSSETAIQLRKVTLPLKSSPIFLSLNNPTTQLLKLQELAGIYTKTHKNIYFWLEDFCKDDYYSTYDLNLLSSCRLIFTEVEPQIITFKGY